MCSRVIKILFVGSWLLAMPMRLCAESISYADFDGPVHQYWARVPQDRFSKAMAARPTLDTTGELPLLRSLLKLLDIPVSSQLLVFSGTSLQSGLIRAANPRSIYFNEDTSVGYVPGGRMEISSVDPVAGMVFFIFDPLNPRAGLPDFNRSNRCMSCHADTPSRRLPGLVVDSVAVGLDGSSLETYRHDEMGHTVPLEQRFGGWHLTGGHHLPKTHANLIGELSPQGLRTTENLPGQRFPLSRYPLPTSDILPHLVHEHQVGFLNYIVEAIYLQREAPEDKARHDTLVRAFTDYILFKGEAKLPSGGISGDPAYIRDFTARGGQHREFDLKTKLFKSPVSYLVTTPVWQMVPEPIRLAVEANLRSSVPHIR